MKHHIAIALDIDRRLSLYLAVVSIILRIFSDNRLNNFSIFFYFLCFRPRVGSDRLEISAEPLY
ncbi:hypothetical protein, partial [Zarconia navalis]|uniref:hypothetical protein n=1 Tax=Zarconia navalis TaxID=2992134 RepID=UPI0021F85CFA